MNKYIYSAPVPDTEIAYIHALYYEMIGTRNLVMQASVNMPEAYPQLRKDYTRSVASYELAFSEIKSKYVPREYWSERYRMYISFDEDILRIEDLDV